MKTKACFLSIGAFCAFFAGGAEVSTPFDSAKFREEFRDPPKSYRPMVRWWWPGGDVTDEELRREIRLLDEAHFGGAEIQPFHIGLNMQAPAEIQQRVNDYRSPKFWGHVEAALQEARGRGMWLDLTFGSGWPFGGGKNITPELASLELRFARTSIQGPQKYAGQLAMPVRPRGFGTVLAELIGTTHRLPEGWAQRLKARETLVAVVAVRGAEPRLQKDSGTDLVGQPQEVVQQPGILEPPSAVVLTDRVAPDGTLHWEVPPGTWQIFTFVQFPADLLVSGGVGEGPQLVLDHLKRPALDSHIEAVGGSAQTHLKKYLGNGLRAVFCDSLEVVAYLFWTDDFLQQFRRLRGYDLTPYLPLLKQPGFSDMFAYESPPLYDDSGAGRRIRHDYWQTVSDLMIENFYKPFIGWAEQNQLLARVQAHGAPADVMRIYGLSHVPETEHLYDHGRYDFLKFAASAAHVYGREIVSSESFVWLYQGYQVTPETLKWRTDELITAGLNQIIYHGFPYEYRDRPEPGWHPFATPIPVSEHMNPHNPFWAYLPGLNDYITRLQYLSRAGQTVTPVALFRNELPYQNHNHLKQRPEPPINTRLLEAGYSFDHINAHALLNSRVQDGRLISPGGAVYQQLILLQEERLSVELAEQLAGFARAGLPVLFVGRVPDEEIGFANYQGKTQRIRALMNEMLGVKELTAVNTQGSGSRRQVEFVKTIERAVEAIGKSVRPNLRFRTPADSVFFIEKQVGPVRVYILRNGSAEERRVEAEFPIRSASPEIWDPWTGAISPLQAFEREAGGVRLPLALGPYASRVIVFDPAVQHAPRQTDINKSNALPPTIALSGSSRRWSLRAEAPTRDGKPESHELQLSGLVDWAQHPQLKNFSGQGRYTTEFALPASYLRRDIRLTLDLGNVRDVADIRVNGRKASTLLLRPYQTDITELVRRGPNTLEITVTNTLMNHLIGAGILQGSADGPMSYAPQRQPSGLLGPVRLIPSRATTRDAY